MRALVLGAVLAVLPLHGSPPDLLFTNPSIEPLVTASTSLLHIHFKETTNATPQKFTMSVTLRVWGLLGAREYRKCGENFDEHCGWIRGKDTLAAPGHSRPYDFTDIRCARNRYYFKLVGTGVTSTGQAETFTLFWPAGDGGKDPHEAPTRLESKLISSCHPH